MSDVWRYRCPEGHTAWRKRVNHDYNRTPESMYYCDTCKKNGDDPHFDELTDMKNPDVAAVQ